MEVIEEQAECQIGQRIANLVEEDEEQDDQSALTLEELHERLPDRFDGSRKAFFLRRLAVSFRFAHDQRSQHGRKREPCAHQSGGLSSPSSGADESNRAVPGPTPSPAY